MGEKNRTFESGANRNSLDGKLCFEGFLNPLVILEFAKYMDKHRTLADGTLRAADNWQNGFPKDVAIDSGFRHFHDWWMEHRGYESREGIKDALCGLLFNVQSYLLTVLEEERANNEEEERLLRAIFPDPQVDPEQTVTEVSGDIHATGGAGGSGLPPIEVGAPMYIKNIDYEKTIVTLDTEPPAPEPEGILQKLPWLKKLVAKG